MKTFLLMLLAMLTMAAAPADVQRRLQEADDAMGSARTCESCSPPRAFCATWSPFRLRCRMRIQ